MPHYDYVCDACGHAMELFQAISESPKRKCPKCGKSKLRRLIGMGAGVLFKGAGFYETDYRSESYKEGERKSTPDADAPAATDAPKAKDAATDSGKEKPAASADGKAAEKKSETPKKAGGKPKAAPKPAAKSSPEASDAKRKRGRG